MELRLDKMNLETNDLTILGNEVYVDLDYERVERDSLQLSLHAHVGDSKDNYRFKLDTVHTVILEENELDEEDSQIIQNNLQKITEWIADTVIDIDTHIKNEITLEDEN